MIHPDFPGVYLAGIECDGATYHGSSSARDRDRVRHLILENLGWRLVRLWSTDYFQDSDESISRIDSRLKDILAEDRRKAQLKEIVLVEEQEISGEDSVLHDVVADELDDSTKTESEISESLSNLRTDEYDHSRYFDDNYKPTLIKIAKDILEEKNGITLHELALDIANLHGLSRTSKKQMKHIIALIKPWAGLVRDGVHKPIVWSRPEDIVDEIPWRGLDVFGYERDWTEIPYAEAKSLARLAIKQSPNSPIDYICKVFKLKRRYEKTLEQFQSWVDDVRVV